MKYLLIACSLLIYVFANGLHHDPVRTQCAECILSLLRANKVHAAHKLLQQFDTCNDLNECSSDGVTVLHYFACRYYSQEWVKLLLEKGANIHGRTAEGYTPFALAVMNNNHNTARILANAGADIEVMLPHQATPLHLLCANYRFVNELEILLARNEFTAPQLVFVKKLLMPVRLLSLKELIAKQYDNCFLKPAVFGTLIPELQVEVLYASLQQKTYLDMQDVSLIKDSTLALELLKNRILCNSNADAPVNKKDAKGDTVLHVLSRSSTQYRFVTFLVKNGADRLTKNNQGLIPRSLIENHELSYSPFRRPVAECLAQPQELLNKINELITMNHRQVAKYES